MYSLVRIVVIVWSSGEMEHWSVQHHSVAVELFIKTESYSHTARFPTAVPRPNAPPQYPASAVSNWPQEGSVKDYKPQRFPRSVHTLDNVERVRNAILRNPHRSSQRHALARRLKDSNVRRIVHRGLYYHRFAQEI